MREWEEYDCPNCAGFGLIRYRATSAGKARVPEYCEECDGLGTIRRQVQEPETDVDRKLVAYTSVASMSNEDFERLIEGRWKEPRKGVQVFERDGEVVHLQLTPVDELQWSNGTNRTSGPTREEVRRSIERSDRKARNMIEMDEQDDRPVEETAYQKYVRYNQERGNDVTSGGFSPPSRPAEPSVGYFARSILDIAKQSTVVARAFIRERILVK